MSRTALISLLLVLAFLGLADAWYLTQAAFDGASLACNFGASLDGCNIVAQSAYSRLFGLPLALYGVGFYGLVFVLGAVLFPYPHRSVYRALQVLGILGVIASIIFLLIQFFLIQALCVYCIASAVIAFAACWVALELWKKYAPPHLVAVS